MRTRIWNPTRRGGYRFTDFIRVVGPLQAVLTVVPTVAIAVIWGL